MKIVYVIETLASTGGTEKMISQKANYLADKLGNDVTIITCSQNVSQPNIFSLSDRVRQIYLGIPLYSQYQYKYPKRLWLKYKLNKQLQSSINAAIQKSDPNILIGVSHFNADVICSINTRAKKIIECHEARFFTLSGKSQHQNLISKLYLKIYRFHYFKTIEKKADVVVTLTQGDKELWNKARRIEVIPNFSNISVNTVSSCNMKRVISVGRLSWEKGYERLIKIWRIIALRYPDWHLDIYGEGELENIIKEEISEREIKNIYFHNYTNRINDEYSKSSIFVMTSHYEGFGLVLLEAMRHGVPCVAFNCPFGPSCIIENDQSGFLVENDNINIFAEKLSLLIKDDVLRKNFSRKAIIRSKVFTIENVMEQWKSLFEDL